MAKIAIDLMGSDLGCEELSQAVKQYLIDSNDEVIIFGEKEKLQSIFVNTRRLSIVDAKDVVPMEIKPLDFLRKKESSLYKAILAVKNGEADCIVTAGSTGGAIIGATFLLKNIEGVPRSGICAPFPTYIKDKACVILDIGANNINTPEDLVAYAKLGRIYAQEILHIQNPNSYVLSNGVEEGKGTEEVVKACSLLKERNFPGFQGNCEARNVLDGQHDIIVTSGFTGNIFLKATEGVASMMNQMIKDAFKHNLFTKIGYLFAKSGFKQIKETMDYRKYGGSILLGINGIVVKAHGNSNAYAFYNAIKVAKAMVDANITEKIHEAFYDKQGRE